MNTYLFYIEYDGRKTVSHGYDVPVETMVADSINHAARQFAEKNKVKKVKLDQLDEKDYRVFFEKKSLLVKPQELVYFVQVNY
ncbi:hypothetical protein [Sporolactobacillus nakayamae]|uniref:Uncharacterized protein n=1 Tax=Sporolactobacillus nakayamae TaxID=269670 RepID=A0A1I2W094_9BACL|nr:hypothetical protein [Sporolactobacillus nakayamae]SFG94800.1 hypothetical protein SAMN02982927_03340 [Sporolactobacillus nakayamae]